MLSPETSIETTSSGSFLNGLQVPVGSYSEVFDSTGATRSHWQKLLTSLDSAGPQGLTDTTEDARRILRDHGVTYNAADQLDEIERPWELDIVPFLIDGEEWKQIEAGAIQRAQLLNTVLNDIYIGPQLLIRDGFIPPGLVYPNPNFLRPCRGVRIPGDVYLHLLAIDIARNPDGSWVVLSDRTQAPSGIGYALENRTIVGRVMPSEFRDCGVQRLDHFFSSFRTTLRELAPSPTAWPRIVFMSPGSRTDAYYEHSLLARFLGITLVESTDLTVRDRRVFLKTLEGLQRVDVIVRRVNDTHCDPLELAGESVTGVPGLVEAVRAGNVMVANGLGSALVESPALIPFLPALARHLLGEELILPSAATWWCGEASEQNRVLSGLDSMIVKNAFVETNRQTFSGTEMSSESRRQLGEDILSRPYEFVGQENLLLSQVPVWTDRGPESRPVVLRIYVAARGDGYHVMPGGLAKVSQSASSPVHGFQVGGSSKDTWVLGLSKYAPDTNRAIELETRPAERLSTGVPSRVADNLFWLGRYSERLENRVHLLRPVLSRLVDSTDPSANVQLTALRALLAQLYSDQSGKPPPEDFDIGEAAIALIYDEAQMNGIISLLLRLRHLVPSVRDRLSGTTWRILNRLGRYPGTPSLQIPFPRATATLNDLVVDLAALSGMEMESMTRGIDWRFLNFGRRLERAYNMCGLLQTALNQAADREAVLNPLLEIADSTMTYRRRYFSEPDLASVLELLLIDGSNPRSIAFQLNEMEEHVSAFPAKGSDAEPLREEQVLLTLRDQLSRPEYRRLVGAFEGNMTGMVDDYFDSLADKFAHLSDALTHRYINLTPPKATVG